MQTQHGLLQAFEMLSSDYVYICISLSVAVFLFAKIRLDKIRYIVKVFIFTDVISVLCVFFSVGGLNKTLKLLYLVTFLSE